MTILEEKRKKVINKIRNTNDESLLNFIDILTNTVIDEENQIDLEFSDFKFRLDNSIDDYHNDRLIDSEDLKKEITKWV